jgi:iron complex transport system permease protein
MMPSHMARWALPAALLLLVVFAVAALGLGDLPLGPSRIWAGLMRNDELATTVIWQIRMPRLIVAVLTGAALSASGLVMQAYFRNSLASPGLLGVSSGGAAGAVVAIACGLASVSLWVLPSAAVFGACVAMAGVIALARRGASTERLLLAGVALNALLGAVTSHVLSTQSAVFDRNAQILFWLLGGLEDRTWEHVLMGLPIVVAAALLWPLGRPMDLLSLGAEEAQTLGVDVRGLRRRLLAYSTVLTAVATAVAGSVGFVGLIVPHTLRLLVGAEHRRLVPLSLVVGGVFVLACDLVCRTGCGLRLGIVTALVGAPFFLWLLRKQA